MKNLKSNLSTFLIVALLLGGFYFLGYNAFLKKDRGEEFPILRQRLGTILYNSSTDHSEKTDLASKKDHVYCYYPSSDATYPGKAGEYIIRKVATVEECQGWYGAAIFNEGNWVSEIEKIWWSKQQKIAEDYIPHHES